MLWHFIRYCITITFPVFYKRIQSKNIHHLQGNGPVVIAMNHPNAFTDPIAVTFVIYPTRLKYLARGDAFKPGWVSFLLEWIGIVPIFRIQDGGKEGLKKNDEAYRRVNQLLKQNHKIIVFAEGLCVQERRLRPLKKGVARMVFGAHDFLEHDELTVVPVGVNYSKPDKIGSTVFYNVGEPIRIKEFEDDFKSNEAKAYNKFMQILEPKMKDLIIHLNNPEYDNAIEQLDEMLMPAMRIEKGYRKGNLEHDHLLRMEIARKLNKAEEKDKTLTDEFNQESERYFKEIREFGIRDWIVDPINKSKLNGFNYYLRVFLIIALSPLFLAGIVANALPYFGVQYLVKNIMKVKREFYSSLSLAIGIFALMINYVILFLTVYAFSPNVLYPLISVLAGFFSGIFSLRFQFFIQKTRGLGRAWRNKGKIAEFAIKRQKLLSLINRF